MKVLRPLTIAFVGLAVAASGAMAQTRAPPRKQQEGVVEQPKVKAKPPARAATASVSPLLRGASAGDLPSDPTVAPRIGGLQAQQYGGSACRASCSTSYMFCQQQDDVTSCSASWARCQSVCPAISSSQ